MNLLAPQQIAEVLQAAAGAGFVSARCTEWAEGVKGRTSKQVWLKIARESLIPTLKRLVENMRRTKRYKEQLAELVIIRNLYDSDPENFRLTEDITG